MLFPFLIKTDMKRKSKAQAHETESLSSHQTTVRVQGNAIRLYMVDLHAQSHSLFYFIFHKKNQYSIPGGHDVHSYSYNI